MATLTGNRVLHPTLAAATVDTVTMSASAAAVEVLNRSAADIYFTTDGSTPTVGGADCDVVIAGQALKKSVPIATATVVKLISASIAAYSVAAV